MDRDPARSNVLKEEGNSHFKKEDYIGAESLYSKAYVFMHLGRDRFEPRLD